MAKQTAYLIAHLMRFLGLGFGIEVYLLIAALNFLLVCCLALRVGGLFKGAIKLTLDPMVRAAPISPSELFYHYLRNHLKGFVFIDPIMLGITTFLHGPIMANSAGGVPQLDPVFYWEGLITSLKVYSLVWASYFIRVPQCHSFYALYANVVVTTVAIHWITGVGFFVIGVGSYEFSYYLAQAINLALSVVFAICCWRWAHSKGPRWFRIEAEKV